MDERWKCAYCGFHNDYDEIECVSCNMPRPDGTLEDEIPEEPTDGLVFTSYLRDLDYDAKPLDLPLYAPRPDYESSSEPIPGSTMKMPIPTLEPMPTPASAPTRPLTGRIAKSLENLKRETSTTTTSGSPPARKALAKLVFFIALAGVAAGVATNLLSKDTSTSAPIATSLPVVTSAPIVADPADNAYFEALSPINVARNGLMEVTNQRWDAWLELDGDGFPTPEYLVMDELETFLAEVQSMSPPVSDEVRSLHDAWTADLKNLVLAEQDLLVDPDQATLDSELEAWQTENASYTALYEYMQARE